MNIEKATLINGSIRGLTLPQTSPSPTVPNGLLVASGRNVAVGRNNQSNPLPVAPPAFSFHQTALQINEGQSVTFNIQTRNVPSDAVFTWQVVSIRGINSNDFSDNALSGQFTYSSSGSYTLTRQLALDYLTEGDEEFFVRFRLNGVIIFESDSVLVRDTSTTPSGAQTYTALGTFNWTVPVGVRSCSVSLIGGGAGGGGGNTGAAYYNGRGGGGGAGGLSVRNSLTVTPGETLSVVVGAGGTGGTVTNTGGNGGQSSLRRGTTVLSSANGGLGGGGSSGWSTGHTNGIGGSGGSGNVLNGASGTSASGIYVGVGGANNGGNWANFERELTDSNNTNSLTFCQEISNNNVLLRGAMRSSGSEWYPAFATTVVRNQSTLFENILGTNTTYRPGWRPVLEFVPE